MLCPKCNSDIPDNATVCPSCGFPLKDSPPISAHCSKCGAEVDNSSAFCPNCGNPIKPPNEKLSKHLTQKQRIGIILAIVILTLLSFYSVTIRYIFIFAALFIGVPISLIALVFCLIRRKPKKRWGIIFTVFLSIGIIYLLFPIPCTHDWQPATCTEPETCSLCGKAKGSALGHNWMAATCTEPKTCSRCDETQGTALGHTLEGSEVDDTDLVMAVIRKRQHCSVCGQMVTVGYKDMTSLHNNGVFLFSPELFTERLSSTFESMANCDLDADLINMSDGTMGTAIMDGRDHIGTILYIDNNAIMDTEAKNSCNQITAILCTFETDNSERQVSSMLGMLLACDPSLSISKASDLGKKIILSVYNSEGAYEKNGIKYLFGVNSDMSGRTQFIASVYES